LLSRVLGIIGPVPEHMMKEGRLVQNYFTREGLIYQEAKDSDETENNESNNRGNKGKKDEAKGADISSGKINILIAKKTTLKARLHTDDYFFIDFVSKLLDIDPDKRLSAKEALKHPFLTEAVYPEDEVKDN
jgi:serine/threonine protein kinase